MSNLTTTFQSRAYISFLYINEDVHRLRILLDSINSQHFADGMMVFILLVILVGKMATSHQATMLVDLAQAIAFSTRLLTIIIRAVVWGIFGI